MCECVGGDTRYAVHGAAQRVDNCEQQFFTKAMVTQVGLRKKELIIIQEETKRMEGKEEAGHRSLTWSILRAMQKINNAKRLEGEATMSAPPFFHSQRNLNSEQRMTDLQWWYGKVQIYRKRIRSSGRKRWESRRIGWFGADRGKKTKSNARLKSMEKKSSQTAASKQTPKQERSWIRKEAKGIQCAGPGKRGGDIATSNAQ